MLSKNDAAPGQRPAPVQSDSQSESALERVKKLQADASRLDETLERVEKTLAEAAGESERSR